MRSSFLLCACLALFACSARAPELDAGTPTAALEEASPSTESMATSQMAMLDGNRLARLRGAKLTLAARPVSRSLSDTRSQDQIDQAACTARDGSWRCAKSRRKPVLAAASSPIIPPSWTVPLWVVDPLDLSGKAIDTNACTSIATPCSSWQEVNDHRWGCQGSPGECPRLQQNTMVMFLSGHATTSDPVYAHWAGEQGAILEFTCALGAAQVVIAGTLASVTARNPPSQLLQASLTGSGGGTVADGQLIDIVHAGAHQRCLVNANVGGSIWNLTQCFVPATIPVTLGQAPAAEVNDAANGDAFTVYQLPTVNFVDVTPVVEEASSAFTQGTYIYQCGDLATTAAPTVMTIGAQVNLVESSIGKPVWAGGPSGVNFNPNVIHNTFLSLGISGVGGIANTIPIQITGGAVGDGNLVYGAGGAGNFSIDGDAILGAGFGGMPFGQQSAMGRVFIGSGTTLSANAGTVSFETEGYGPPLAWGAGRINVWNGSRIALIGGATATNTFTNTGGLTINGQTTACSHSGANSPDVINCGISLTPANIDAAQGTGGFGGYAFIPGGGAICKVGGAIGCNF